MGNGFERHPGGGVRKIFSPHSRTRGVFDRGLPALGFLVLAIGLLASEGANASITLNSISIDPNPSSAFDYLTVTADGEDVNYYDTNPDTNFHASGGANPGGWNCLTVESDITGDINHIDMDFINEPGIGDCGGITGVAFLEYVSAVQSGEIYFYDIIDFGGSPPSFCRTKGDINSATMQAGVTYWLCIKTTANPWPLDADTTETRLWYNGLTDPNGIMTGYTDRSSEGIPLYYPVLKTYSPTQLTVINLGGNYSSDYLCKGDYSDANKNAFCSFQNPCTGGNCTIKGKIYSEGSGWSGEAQATITIGSVTDLDLNTLALPIYVMANSDFGAGVNETYRLHEPYGFSAYPSGGYAGRIQIDGELFKTCNADANCIQVVDTGFHTYTLYSTIGSYKYTGTFTRDLNTPAIKIYVPITYNIFDIYTDLSETSLLSCSSIYSVKNNMEAGSYGMISTFIHDEINGQAKAFDSNSVVPRNCYDEMSLSSMHYFRLARPTSVLFSDSTPLTAEYSWEEIIAMAFGGFTPDEAASDVWFLGYADSFVGTQSTQGYLNLYRLFEDSEAPHNGAVGLMETHADSVWQQDLYYSPLTDFTKPSMNEETYYYADANHYPGNLAIGDNVYCEARLLSHGFVTNAVYINLIANDNVLLGQSSITPYVNYTRTMDTVTGTSVGNLVYHKFEDVDPGGAATIRCAFRTVNTLGKSSGWVFSNPRQMLASRETTAGGASILVKDEDGTVSQLRHKSQRTGDENYFDIIYYDFDSLAVGYNTKDNPFTIRSGSSYALTQDRNATALTWIAGKYFYANIGGTLDLSLYLPDADASDQTPVIESGRTQQLKDEAKIKCSAEFYDKDLDANKFYFKFWTNASGNSDSPICFSDGTAYTTNCGNEDSIYYIPETDCLAQTYQKYSSVGFYSECGSANDCEAEVFFYYKDCVPAGSTLGYCQIEITDSNGNTGYYLTSVPLEAQEYNPSAECALYNVGNDDSPKVAVYSEELSYAECSVTVAEVLAPNFYDFNAYFLGNFMPYRTHTFSVGTGRRTLFYRLDTTELLHDFMQENAYVDTGIASDSKVWAKGLDVDFTSTLYGNFTGRITTIILQSTAETYNIPGEYSEEDFDELFEWVDGLASGMMTNPIKTIQGNFFTFLILVFLAIIFAPLAIMAALAQAKQGKQGG